VAHNRGQMSSGIFIWTEEGAVLTVSLLSRKEGVPLWITRFLDDTLNRHDLPLLEQFLDRAVGGARALGVIGPTVRFFAPLLNQPAPVSRLVADRFANLHMYYPDAVDDALSEVDSAGAFQSLVRDRAPVENLSELLVDRLTVFVSQSVMFGATDGRVELVRSWLASAASCSNPRQWLKGLITEFANVVYGGRLF
jgi:hypothetical protein